MAPLICDKPPVEESKLVGSHRKAGIPLGAGSHRKEFSGPLFLKSSKITVNNIVMVSRSLMFSVLLVKGTG